MGLEHCEHEHFHEHGAGRSHAPKDFGRAFMIGIGLNLALVVGQVAFGLLAHSLALVADAGHNFGDVLRLRLAWWATTLSKSTPTRRHTYGLRGASISVVLPDALGFQHVSFCFSGFLLSRLPLFFFESCYLLPFQTRAFT